MTDSKAHPVALATTAQLVDAIGHAGGKVQRRAMAKAITLVESTRSDHRLRAQELLSALLPHSGRALRLGISGVPGVGKSTFIEALGLYLIEQGRRVAVLTIDPSSSVSGGSILADKTRMERLCAHERAYIRPSPSGGTLGGVAGKTREAMLICEAAGYDVMIIETVGVGQSETAVASMTDLFALLLLPNAGDELQAIKKGVMELADLVVVNKADLDEAAASRARAQLTSTMSLLGLHGNPERSRSDPQVWRPRALQLSALSGQGVAAFWSVVLEFKLVQEASGEFVQRRKRQALAWMWERIEAGLKQDFGADTRVQSLLTGLTQDVLEGRMAASTAAQKLLATHMNRA